MKRLLITAITSFAAAALVVGCIGPQTEEPSLRKDVNRGNGDAGAGQPDFAHLVIDYIADQLIVESKSLKIYLASFRNQAAFHEDCTVGIAKRLVKTLSPKWLRIGGYWYPRGGIPIDVFYQTGIAPANVWIPDQGVATYRGRG